MRSRSTRLSPEPWPWVGRPRVLIEHPDDAASLALASILRRAGYAVAVCPGPEESERCPLRGPEGCAIAHGADVVVSSLGLDRVEAREVLQALRSRVPETQLVVEVAAGEAAGWSDLLEGCEVVSSPSPPSSSSRASGPRSRGRVPSMRNPFRSEAEAFRFLLLTIVAFAAIALASLLGGV